MRFRTSRSVTMPAGQLTLSRITAALALCCAIALTAACNGSVDASTGTSVLIRSATRCWNGNGSMRASGAVSVTRGALSGCGHVEPQTVHGPALQGVRGAEGGDTLA